ncbi:MAG: phenylalanine 4-monooxygenase [Verrucomicrobiota bacterium]|jgi:phenylalanine-4-hydroxylase
MKGSKYVSHPVDAAGQVAWSDEENAIWAFLVERQLRRSRDTACHNYLEGLETLNLPRDRVPQLEEVNAVLRRCSGWELAAVPALIDFDTFFELLAARRFPCATFIRTRDEIDYLQEPDIFHEIFGHCPMLTDPRFADFTHRYAKMGKAACHKDRVRLARLYWFTVEFGLIREAGKTKIYGGGILSSIGETDHALSAPGVIHEKLDLVQALRTPYRIDIMQPKYFVIDSLDELEELHEERILAALAEASSLGLLPPLFPPKAS